METTPPSSTEGSLKALKIIFFAMMLILIGGAVFLFVSIYERNQGKNVSKQCSEGDLILPVQGEVGQILQRGDEIILLTKEKEKRQELIVLDDCTGKVLKRVILNSDKKS